MSTNQPQTLLMEEDGLTTILFGPTGTHRSMIISQLAEDAGISYREMEERVSLQSPRTTQDKPPTH
ncbi:hypothetical protein [Marinobacter salicampi]|uniref:hypothetical protein n=1 Tax=Marinobacter salicampi TaxID=435907 RepID=UPI00140CA8A0|nr:hypothetical protein [Marinobacter salicampi]